MVPERHGGKQPSTHVRPRQSAQQRVVPLCLSQPLNQTRVYPLTLTLAAGLTVTCNFTLMLSPPTPIPVASRTTA